MLQRAYTKSKLVGKKKKIKVLVRTITVRMDETFALDDLDDRFEIKVATRRF
jgi:hypothetical protein